MTLQSAYLRKLRSEAPFVMIVNTKVNDLRNTVIICLKMDKLPNTEVLPTAAQKIHL